MWEWGERTKREHICSIHIVSHAMPSHLSFLLFPSSASLILPRHSFNMLTRSSRFCYSVVYFCTAGVMPGLVKSGWILLKCHRRIRWLIVTRTYHCVQYPHEPANTCTAWNLNGRRSKEVGQAVFKQPAATLHYSPANAELSRVSNSYLHSLTHNNLAEILMCPACLHGQYFAFKTSIIKEHNSNSKWDNPVITEAHLFSSVPLLHFDFGSSWISHFRQDGERSYLFCYEECNDIMSYVDSCSCS